jgi:hypothetical protein
MYVLANKNRTHVNLFRTHSNEDSITVNDQVWCAKSSLPYSNEKVTHARDKVVSFKQGY